MSSKHTPGPWHSFQQADSTRHLVVQGDGSRPNEPIIAYVSGATATLHAAEAANARLIAAAPDLLAACKALLQYCVTPTGVPDKGKGRAPEQQTAMDAARAAIARAEGGGECS